MAGGEGEARARERKAQALPREVAELYQALRVARERGADPEEFATLARRIGQHPDEWLLQRELAELEARR